MNSWKFNFVLCLITLYIVGISSMPTSTVESEDEGDGDKGQDGLDTWLFDAAKRVIELNRVNVSQINCQSEDLCKETGLTLVNCTGNFNDHTILKSNDNYTCESYQVDSNVYSANYTIECLDANEKDKYKLERCWLDVNLEKQGDDGPGSNIGLIVGIVIGVVVIIAAVVVVLGWKGIGPMKSVFNY